MITQSEYETFRDNINALIQEYREKFSVPMITDSKEYEATYRKRLLGKVDVAKKYIGKRVYVIVLKE